MERNQTPDLYWGEGADFNVIKRVHVLAIAPRILVAWLVFGCLSTEGSAQIRPWSAQSSIFDSNAVAMHVEGLYRTDETRLYLLVTRVSLNPRSTNVDSIRGLRFNMWPVPHDRSVLETRPVLRLVNWPRPTRPLIMTDTLLVDLAWGEVPSDGVRIFIGLVDTNGSTIGTAEMALGGR